MQDQRANKESVRIAYNGHWTSQRTVYTKIEIFSINNGCLPVCVCVCFMEDEIFKQFVLVQKDLKKRK